MPRSVFCKKYQQELEGLDAPPYPGPKGQDVFENVSAQAWQEWEAGDDSEAWESVSGDGLDIPEDD